MEKWTLSEMDIRKPLSPLKDEENPRIKSSQRLTYEAQVDVIKKQIGDLENLRETLGLSRRKLAQLLLVDPSALTRWQKEGSTPPHIYRALQWYMIIQEKIPGLTSAYFLHADTTPMVVRIREKADRTQTQNELAELRLQISQLKKWLLALALISVSLLGGVIWYFKFHFNA